MVVSRPTKVQHFYAISKFFGINFIIKIILMLLLPPATLLVPPAIFC